MHARGNFDRGNGQSVGRKLDFPGAVPKRFDFGLEFEEIDDFAGDAADVRRMIERDGSVAPDLGSFDLE
jgi:hypothetical protein